MSRSGKHAALAAVALGVLAAAAAFAITVGAALPSAPMPTLSPQPSEATSTPTPVTSTTTARQPSASPTPVAGIAASGVLRVYSNNIENLVYNNPDRSCTAVGADEHLESMLVDESGQSGTDAVQPPDLLLLQQVGGVEQAMEYADAVAQRFGYPRGTYGVIVAWDEPEEWGYTHDCRQRALGRQKGRQTNGILFNSRTLALTDTSEPWSAGWLPPGVDYAGGRGCRAYEPPHVDANPARRAKWQRTTAIAARFTIRGTDIDVFAASMHLPRQNLRNPCAGDGDTGMTDSGIRLGEDARRLLKGTSIRAVGVDANRTRLGEDVLDGYGLTGHGASRTMPRSKIDYLFVRGDVRSSEIDHTVPGTRSNHLALYTFIDY